MEHGIHGAHSGHSLAFGGAISHHGGYHSGHPHGSMAFGCENGLGYGHALGALSHLGIADIVTLGIFVDFAMGHASHSLHAYNLGHYGDVPGLHGMVAPDNNGRECFLPGIARDETTIEALYWPHRHCDPQEKIRQMMAKMKMVRINPAAMFALEDVDLVEDRIMTWSSFDPADPANNAPNGWYEDVSGSTHVWREYYQIQPCAIPVFGKSKWVPWRTFLVVSGSTWYYKETDDYETRVAFTVFSVPFVDERSHDWTWDWKAIKAYREQAERLASGIYSYLSSHPASAESARKRSLVHTPAVEEEQEQEQSFVPAASIGYANVVPPLALIDEDDGPGII